MRGKEQRFSYTQLQARITPAYAGKSEPLRIYLSACWDHPRVCGEKAVEAATSQGGQGSPPRMRGKDVLHCDGLSQIGITPAYAGKSRGRCQKEIVAWDHPRVCGEKRIGSNDFRVRLGSPPRMRGKVTFASALHKGHGITPAYAGKSFPCWPA